MNDLKYIIFRIGTAKMYWYKACVFNGMLVHAGIAAEHVKEDAYEVHSAGFCKVSINGYPMVKCWGESESLKVKSDPSFDEQVITETLFNLTKF
ncbi:hypothetical protein JMN32_19705 [Fulvivirga sp. 29W222]|uniref:Uncharacterized protein n=1 Tax=Fulvivirga marina TaxID=2494733 RepID=A0A937KCW2_9BACT|nr:hypothetical protein [Fulvivirga marina]MBL6448546.1 hypothetical protein [Fulvivirga marina]